MEKKNFILFSMCCVLLCSTLRAHSITTPTLDSGGNTLFFMGENWGVFFETDSKKFFAIQYKNKPNIEFSEKITVRQYTKNGLTIYDAGKGTIYHFKLDAAQKDEYEIFGISAFEGEGYQTQLLTYEQNQIRLNQAILARGSQVLNCECKPPKSRATCDQGGEGATEFSFTESYNGKGLTLAINCKRGYFACYIIKR